MGKNKAAIFLIFPFLIFLPFVAHGTQAAEPQPNAPHSYLRHGVERVFNLEPDSAFASLQKAIDLDRENPMGYAFLPWRTCSSTR